MVVVIIANDGIIFTMDPDRLGPVCIQTHMVLKPQFLYFFKEAKLVTQ